MTAANIPDNAYDARYRFRLSLLAPSNWPTWFALLLLFIITLLPLRVVNRIGERLGVFIAGRNRKRLNIVSRNLALYFPDASEQQLAEMARQNFAMQYRSLIHYFMIWWRPRSYLLKHIGYEGFEKLEKAREQGRNIILLLSHSVGLEFAVSAISYGLPCTGIYKKLPNPVMEWLIVAGRRRFYDRFGSQIFNRDDGLRPILKRVRSGNALIYLADEDLGETRSVFAPLFGVQKATIPLLGRLAKLGKAEVYPCISCFDEDEQRYVFHVLDKIDGLTGNDDVADATLMNRAIEETIGICPLQYLWSLRYFKTRPDGEAAFYE